MFEAIIKKFKRAQAERVVRTYADACRLQLAVFGPLGVDFYERIALRVVQGDSEPLMRLIEASKAAFDAYAPIVKEELAVLNGQCSEASKSKAMRNATQAVMDALDVE